MDKLIENITRYLEARIELIKIDVQQKLASAIVSMIQLGLIFFLILFMVIFASAGLANYLNSVIGNSYAGFLIVAGFYLLLFFIVKASHKAIQAKVEKVTENMFTTTKEKEEAHASDEVEVVVDRATTHTDIGAELNRPKTT